MSNREEEKGTTQISSVQLTEWKAAWPNSALFLGNMVSSIGDILTLLAIPWFVLQITGSVVQAGITGFCSALSMVFSEFFGSILVDRVGL